MFDAVPDDLQLSASDSFPARSLALIPDRVSSPPRAADYTATVTYDKAAPTVNEVLIDEYEFFDDMAMVPRLNFTMEPADIDVPMVFGFDTWDTGTNRAFFNEMCVHLLAAPLPWPDLRLPLQHVRATDRPYHHHRHDDGRECQ